MLAISGDLWVKIAVIALGLGGYVVARHIHRHKRPNASPLVCPIGFDCHGVVHSSYSRFLGVPVEIFGMAYYALITLAYVVFAAWPAIMPAKAFDIMLLSPLVAFLFSLYLISVQIFVLRKGCFWCYISSVISMLIFGITIAAYGMPALR